MHCTQLPRPVLSATITLANNDNLGVCLHYEAVDGPPTEGAVIRSADGEFRAKSVRVGRTYIQHLYRESPAKHHRLNLVDVLHIKLWHERMGHLDWEAIKRTCCNSPLLAIKLDASEPHGTCERCIAGKAKRQTFKSSPAPFSSEPLELIHGDLVGPAETIGGKLYACVLVCDCTRYLWVFFMKSEDETLRNFETFVSITEKLTRRRLETFRSDRGGEFMSDAFTKFLEGKWHRSANLRASNTSTKWYRRTYEPDVDWWRSCHAPIRRFVERLLGGSRGHSCLRSKPFSAKRPRMESSTRVPIWPSTGHFAFSSVWLSCLGTRPQRPKEEMGPQRKTDDLHWVRIWVRGLQTMGPFYANRRCERKRSVKRV